MSLAEAAPLPRGERHSQQNNISDVPLDDTTPRASAMINEAGSQIEDSSKKDKDGKSKKRNLFGFGKKKTSDGSKSPPKTASDNAPPPAVSRDASKLSTQSATSPTQSEKAYALPSSPGRGISSSPRLSSPARSQIFERDVQDSTVLKPNSPAIPTHIQTENYIPPVLDDASEAITNEKLDPDSVEIVTHTSHQPASVTVTGTYNATSTPYDQTASEWAQELASFADRDHISGDNISNYGSLDSADVRRLSFISFADVVQAEHPGHGGVGSSRESIHLAGLTSLPAASLNRSPSPIRSPVSSQGPETSPPTSNPGSMKGLELSPKRKPLGSPKSGQTLNTNGDLNIETMSQALRRTGSTDLSTARSIPTSPVEPPLLR